MTHIDLYWQENDDWWEFVDHVPTIKESAPPEAQESYKRYLEQIKSKAL